MKTLSLYIDRWYIAAAVCYDNIPRRIDLPNREDRIWLYFYEDINVSSTNSKQSKLCINSPLHIDARLLWKQAISSNSP